MELCDLILITTASFFSVVMIFMLSVLIKGLKTISEIEKEIFKEKAKINEKTKGKEK